VYIVICFYYLPCGTHLCGLLIHVQNRSFHSYFRELRACSCNSSAAFWEKLAALLIKESEVFGDVSLLKYRQYFCTNNLLLL